MNLLVLIIAMGVLWNPEPVWSDDTSAKAVVVGGKDVSTEIVQQANYYIRLLALDHQVYIKISMRTWMPRGIQGFTLYHDDRDRGGVQQVHIFIGKQLPSLKQERTLAHEMAHVEQFIAKRLVKCGNKYYRWDGGRCVYVNRIPYSNRAWEQEAIKRGNQLYADFQRKDVAHLYRFP